MSSNLIKNQVNQRFNVGLNYAVGTIGAVLIDSCINPKMFPWLAKFDGVTDDRAAIQAATNTGKAILFPDGVCKCSGITYTGKVVWISKGNTKILSDGDVLTVTNGTDSIIDNIKFENITAPWIITRNPANWDAVITPVQSNADGYQPTVNDADIWGSLTGGQQNQNIGPSITFQGNAENINISRIAGRFVSVLVKDAIKSTVRDCNFRAGKNFAGGIVFWNIDAQAGHANKALDNTVTFASNSGICFARNFDGSMIGNTCEYVGESGVKTYQNTVGAVDARCYRMQVLNNQTQGCYYDGLDLSSDYPHTGTIDSRHQIQGNTTYGNRMTGVFADGMNNQFEGNTARKCGLSGITLTYSYSQIQENFVYDCNTSNAASGTHQLQVIGGGNGIIGNFIRQTVANGNAIYAPGANYVAHNFAQVGTFFFGNVGAITATLIGNQDAGTETHLTNSVPQQIRQNSAGIAALRLYSESSSVDSIDQVFHPRKHTLANPIAKITGKLSMGSSGAENGWLQGYGAQGGALVPGWTVQTDNAIPGKAWLTINTPNAAPYAGWLGSGTTAMCLDEATNTLKFIIKYSNGTTFKSGSIALV